MCVVIVPREGAKVRVFHLLFLAEAAIGRAVRDVVPLGLPVALEQSTTPADKRSKTWPPDMQLTTFITGI